MLKDFMKDFMITSTEATPEDANHSLARRIGSPGWNLYRDEPQKFWDNVLWTDETKINLYQSDEKATVWRKKGSAHDPKHTSSSEKDSGGNVMAWACMASSGTGSLIFIDYVTHDGSSKINSKVHRKFCLPI